MAQPLRNRSSFGSVLFRSRLKSPVGCRLRVKQPLACTGDTPALGTLAGPIVMHEQNTGVNEWGNLSPWSYPNPASAPWPMRRPPEHRRAVGGCGSSLLVPSLLGSGISAGHVLRARRRILQGRQRQVRAGEGRAWAILSFPWSLPPRNAATFLCTSTGLEP